MGEESGVSRAVRLVELGREGELEGLKQRLLALASRGSEGPLDDLGEYVLSL
jgi:hypothetical protein